MAIIWIVCSITLMMLVWFKTDAILDWGELIGLFDFLDGGEFYMERLKWAPAELNYPSFLNIKYNNFFTKLLACPYCLSFWMVSSVSFAIGFLLLDIGLILLIPVTYILTLIVYGIVTKLLK